MTFEEELKQIDHEIRKLKIQYDLFFVGSAPRPPTQQREALGEVLKKLQFADMRNAADRFLYNSLMNKFNAFQELWIKAMRRREEGARVHPLAARHAHQEASDREKRRKRRTETGDRAGPSEPAGADTGAPVVEEGFTPAWRIPTGEAREESLKGLYESFLVARRRAGNTRALPYDTFAREISRQAAVLRGRSDCEAIEFRIYSVDKKVTIRARPAT